MQEARELTFPGLLRCIYTDKSGGLQRSLAQILPERGQVDAHGGAGTLGVAGLDGADNGHVHLHFQPRVRRHGSHLTDHESTVQRTSAMAWRILGKSVC